MAINEDVSPYDAFKYPLGSVCSVLSSQTTNTSLNPGHYNHFNLIVNSGCTKHMFPYKELFISYKDTPSSFVILADKSKVSCSGVGTVCLLLRNKSIILHDVLHVPKLRSPLLSVRCFRRLAGCSFVADNSGSFLTFPTFILPVDNSSDCTIPGHSCPHFNVDFDSRNTGSATAVSDNTRFKHNRRPILSSTTSQKHPVGSDFPTPNTTPLKSTPSDSSTDISSTVPDCESSPLESTLQHLDTTSTLSPTQIKEITTTIVNHLQKHGRVT
jgi:hypothetical protein